MTLVFLPPEERHEIGRQGLSGGLVASTWPLGVMVAWFGTDLAIDSAHAGLIRAATVGLLGLVGVIVPATLTRRWWQASEARRS